jgi:hypothetical protein
MKSTPYTINLYDVYFKHFEDCGRHAAEDMHKSKRQTSPKREFVELLQQRNKMTDYIDLLKEDDVITDDLKFNDTLKNRKRLFAWLDAMKGSAFTERVKKGGINRKQKYDLLKCLFNVDFDISALSRWKSQTEERLSEAIDFINGYAARISIISTSLKK